MEMRDDIRALRSVVDSVAREAAARARSLRAAYRWRHSLPNRRG